MQLPEPTLEVTLNTAQNTPCFLEVTWQLRVQPALDELAARGWLNPPQIGSVCPNVAPCVDSVQTTVITPATCLELRLDQADAEIRGTVSFAYGTPVAPTRLALVWAWSDRGEWTQTEAAAVAGTGTPIYALAVVSDTC